MALAHPKTAVVVAASIGIVAMTALEALGDEGSGQPTAVEHCVEGHRLAEQEQPGEALSALEAGFTLRREMLERHPAVLSQCAYTLARLRRETGDTVGARKALETAAAANIAAYGSIAAAREEHAPDASRVWRELGNARRSTGRCLSARAAYSRALQIARLRRVDSQDTRSTLTSEAATLIELGDLLRDRELTPHYSEIETAEQAYESARAIQEQLSEPAEQARALIRTGRLLQEQAASRHGDARDAYTRAMRIADTQWRAQASAIRGLAELEMRQRNHVTATALLSDVVNLAEKHDDIELHAQALREIGVVYRHAGQYSESIKWLHQSLGMQRAEGLYRDTCVTLMSLAESQMKLGSFGAAWHSCDEADELALEHSVPGLDRTIADCRGDVRFEMGLYADALTYYQILVDQADRSCSIRHAYQAHRSRGNAYKKMGWLASAKVDLEIAKDQAKVMGDPFVRNAIRNDLALLYVSLGSACKALGHLESALNYARNADDLANEATATINLCQRASHLQWCDEKAGAPPSKEAESLHVRHGCAIDEVDARFGAVDDAEVRARVHLWLGKRLVASGDIVTGTRHLEQARDVYAAMPSTVGVAQTGLELARALVKSGELQKALAEAEAALASYRITCNAMAEANACVRLGQLHEHRYRQSPYAPEWSDNCVADADASTRVSVTQSDRDLALMYYLEAIDLVEDVRSKVDTAEHRSGFFEQHLTVYDRAVRLSLTSADPHGAFSLSERGRSRSLQDALLQWAADADNATCGAPTGRPLEKCRPAVSEPIRNQPLPGTDALAREIASVLDNDTALISYWVLPERTVAFTVSRSRFRVQCLPVGRDQVERDVEDWVRKIGDGKRSAGTRTERELYRHIRGTSQDLNHRPHRLILVPHGDLHRISFAALHGENGFLINEFAISYAASADAFVDSQKRARSTDPAHTVHDGALVVGYDDPTKPNLIPAAEDVGRSIARRLGTHIYDKDDASKSIVIRHAPDAGFVLIAAHGGYWTDTGDEGVNRARSSITLALGQAENQAERKLRPMDVMDLNLSSTDLVVLAACGSGRPAPSGDDEYFDLARASRSRGAHSVVFGVESLPVQPTMDIVEQFTSLLLCGVDKAEALRRAQRSVLQEVNSEPRAWSKLVLLGDNGPLRARFEGTDIDCREYDP